MTIKLTEQQKIEAREALTQARDMLRAAHTIVREAEKVVSYTEYGCFGRGSQFVNRLNRRWGRGLDEMTFTMQVRQELDRLGFNGMQERLQMVKLHEYRQAVEFLKDLKVPTDHT